VSAFLLDTNVISELIKPKPEPKVTVWIDATDEDLLFLSLLTLGEIRKGVVLPPRSARRIALEAWLSKELPLRFYHRILSVDQEVADRWGHLSGLTCAKGVQVSVPGFLRAQSCVQEVADSSLRQTKTISGGNIVVSNTGSPGCF
jgi:toxin FitB